MYVADLKYTVSVNLFFFWKYFAIYFLSSNILRFISLTYFSKYCIDVSIIYEDYFISRQFYAIISFENNFHKSSL